MRAVIEWFVPPSWWVEVLDRGGRGGEWRGRKDLSGHSITWAWHRTKLREWCWGRGGMHGRRGRSVRTAERTAQAGADGRCALRALPVVASPR